MKMTGLKIIKLKEALTPSYIYLFLFLRMESKKVLKKMVSYLALT